MEELEITQEEVRGIDINQVSSMQLKDGTVVVVNSGEGQYDNQGEGEFTLEELSNQENYMVEQNSQESNQLRARPFHIGVYPRRPPMMHVKPYPPKPFSMHRGPASYRPMSVGYGMGFRARPFYGPKAPMYGFSSARPVSHVTGPRFPPQKQNYIPVTRPNYGFVPKPGYAPVNKPGFTPQVQKPLLNQIITDPRFRARAQVQEEEQEFQEEEFIGEDQYCECDEQCQEEENNQLRGRPYYGPVVSHLHPVQPMGIKAQHFPRAVRVPPRRGPVHGYPGYNTFQPRAFRARPIPGRLAHPSSMFNPLNRTYQPPFIGGPKLMKPPIHHHRGVFMNAFGPNFRSRPRSSSYDVEHNQNSEEICENECQLNTECNKTCVCIKCGKEF